MKTNASDIRAGSRWSPFFGVACLVLLVGFCFGPFVSAYDFENSSRARNCDIDSAFEFLDAAEDEIRSSRTIEASSALVATAMQVDLLMVGEIHLQPAAKRTLRESLSELHKKGFGVLGLEMLNQSAQAEVDRYCNGDLSRDEFSKVWRANWSYSQVLEDYLALVDEACALGMRVVALDVRDWFNRSEPEYDRMDARNYMMANQVLQMMKTEQSKAVALAGSLHTLHQQLWKSPSVRYREMTRTTIPSYVQELRPETKVAAAFIGESVLELNDPRYCMATGALGEFSYLGEKSPYAKVVKRPSFMPVDLLLLQSED